MGCLSIEEGGFLTTIQDAGRYGYRNWGMPVSGAMDRFSFEVSNILVGNDRREAALEITLTGPVVRFKCKMIIAITGAEMNPMINGNPAEMWRSIVVGRGDTLSFGRLESGVRCYLAVRGGLNIGSVMGSKSTYLRGAIGGIEGRKLVSGDKIPVRSLSWLTAGRRKAPPEMIPQWHTSQSVMITEGGDFYRFTEESRERLVCSSYTVTPYFDRMGIRLSGYPLSQLSGKADVLSYPLTGGTIQVSGDGQPLIMVADSQTIGGYTQIANIITAELYKTGQIKQGDSVEFRLVSQQEAIERLREQTQQIISLKKGSRI